MREILMAIAAVLIYLGIIGVLIWDTVDQIKHHRRIGRRVFFFTAFMALIMAVNAKAEVRKGWATAYCKSGTTASGTVTTENRTVAGQRKDFGKTVHIWLDDGSGMINPENFVGTYVIEDTGGEPIKNGRVLDIYMPELKDCRQFGGRKIIYFVEEEDDISEAYGE